MTSLYQIAAEYRADLDRMADLDLDAQTVADTLEGMQGDLRDKLRNVIGYALHLSILAAGTKEAAARMADLAKARQTRSDAMLQYALDQMIVTGLPSIDTDEFSAKPAKKPPSVNVTDLALLPAAYWRTPEPPAAQPDKQAIAQALKLGTVVPGAELVAGFRLSVK